MLHCDSPARYLIALLGKKKLLEIGGSSSTVLSPVSFKHGPNSKAFCPGKEALFFTHS